MFDYHYFTTQSFHITINCAKIGKYFYPDRISGNFLCTFFDYAATGFSNC